MKKITIKDVAREAGVSVTLVSFVMNAKVGKDGRLDCPVNPDTAARVLEVAKRLGYRRNVAAASLRSGRSDTIAVITTDISNNFFAGISRYIEDKAVQYGYTVLFGSSDENPDKLDNVMDTVLAYNIDGIIVAPVPGGEKAINRAIEAKVPVVLLDRDMEGTEETEGVGKVLLDDVEEAFHVLALRDVALDAPVPRQPPRLERLGAVRDRLLGRPAEIDLRPFANEEIDDLKSRVSRTARDEHDLLFKTSHVIPFSVGHGRIRRRRRVAGFPEPWRD